MMRQRWNQSDILDRFFSRHKKRVSKESKSIPPSKTTKKQEETHKFWKNKQYLNVQKY